MYEFYWNKQISPITSDNSTVLDGGGKTLLDLIGEVISLKKRRGSWCMLTPVGPTLILMLHTQCS
jgi:hypothetical protein